MLQKLLRTLRRRTAIIVVPSLVASALLIPLAMPASAMNGNVPDNRPATPLGEITAQYWHALNRDPDPGGLNNYMSWANKDCRWGVMDDSFKIDTSAEAVNVWRDNPQTLAGMLYASLLNRPPDPSGLVAYTNGIRANGLRWAVASMEASPEYQGRLAAICAGRSSSDVGMLPAASAVTIGSAGYLSVAADLATACGLAKFTSHVLDAADDAADDSPAAADVEAVNSAAELAMSLAGSDESCKAAVQMVFAAARIAAVAYPLNGPPSPVFIEQDLNSHWELSHPLSVQWCEGSIRVGPDTADWTQYSPEWSCT